MKKVLIRWIDYGSAEYQAEVELRYRILRQPLGLEFTSEQLAQEAFDKHIGAFEDGRLVGCLFLSPQENNTLKMRQVAVHPDLQGRGIGKQLVYFSETYARESGFAEIHLRARETAVKFYLSLGYELEGSPLTEVGLPHRVMRKRIT
jgi:N-acetylglutamate synthase-like GNAT family acetyltransferase